MSRAPEKLQKILRAGDVPPVLKFFEGAPEDDRRAVAPVVVAWCKQLDLNRRAQFNRKAQAEIEKTGTIKNWHSLMPAANAAALACANIGEIKTLRSSALPQIVVQILADRRPSWMNEYAELLCEGELHHWGGHWKVVRALVRAGLCRPPRHENYVLQALNGIWPPFDLREHLQRQKEAKPPLPEPTLANLLLEERDWLESDFWRLFELDGTGEVSLANTEKYGKGRQTWSEALVKLSHKEVLSRDKLLDASLSALSRDFIQFRAGWFSRFHEALLPTLAERTVRIEAYLRLLASCISPTVAFALNAAAIVDEAVRLPATKLTTALAPALSARGKIVVSKALQLLNAAAEREPTARKSICLAALPALLNEAPDLQKSVFDLLDRYGGKEDAALRSKLEESAAAVAASLKNRLAPWLGTSATETKQTPASSAAAATKVVSRIDPSRALIPIKNLDDLIHAASAMLEEPADPNQIEQILDGVSRLCDQRPDDFGMRTGPLRKRAVKKRDERRGTLLIRPTLERALAMFLLTWIEQRDGFTEKPESLGGGQNQYSFLFHRLREISRRVEVRRPMPLLSAPTHAGGWIAPPALVERWLAWQKSSLEPDSFDQVLALLRLAPDDRREALSSAKALDGEPGQALRFALGDDHKTGANAALWLAAWRSRQPFGDLPEFEARHPRLGPDAGVGARYTWEAASQHRTYQSQAWTNLKLTLQTEPPMPKKVDSKLLPILFHSTWLTGEEREKYLLRWATQLWPANREAAFAHACTRLEISVDYADALDSEFCSYLEPLSDPHTELRPMACLALALGLAAQDNGLRSHAQDGLIAAMAENRLNVSDLGGVMSRLLDTGLNKFARWARTLREAARVSPMHAVAAATLISTALHGDPSKAPRDIHALLELLLEFLSESDTKLNDVPARNFLAALAGGGKTAKLAKRILAT